MEQKKEVIFPDGLSFKRPHEKAPEFVKGSVSVNVARFTEWLKKYPNEEWLNFDLKVSQKGTLYFQLNEYKKSTAPSMTPAVTTENYPKGEINPDLIPF